jgi:hypothetical protein
VQVLILYHLVTAKAAVAVSGDATTSRADGSDAESAPAQGAAAATTESQEA